MNNIYYFIIGSLPLFSPLFFYKSAFTRFTLIAFAYPVWLLLGMYIGLPQSRIVGSVGLEFYAELVPTGFWTALLCYVSFIVVTWGTRNVDYNFQRLPLQFSIRLVLFLIFIVSVAVAYPAAMGFGGGRFGSLGSLVVVFFTLLCCSKPNNSNFDIINFAAGLFILFLVTRGERVDFILMLAALLFFSRRNSFLSFFKIAVIATSFLFLAIIGGLSREGVDLSVYELLQLVIYAATNFGTAVDVVHVYMSAIWYIHNVGYEWRPLANVVASFIPLMPEAGVSSKFNFVWILREYIPNLGGGLFYAAFYMAGGTIGAMVGGVLYGFLYKFLFTMKGYPGAIFIAFFVMQFRLQWYGLNYFGMVFFVIFFIVVLLIFMRGNGFVLLNGRRYQDG